MRIICLIILLVCTSVLHGQVNFINSQDSDRYMRAGDGNRTAFKVLSITGASLVIIGSAMFLTEMTKPPGEFNQSRSRTGETLVYVGGGLLIASIPFKIASGRNEILRGDLSLNAKPPVYKPGHNARYIPSVSVSIRL